MKRKIAFGMALAAMVCFCGCGNKEYSASDSMYAGSDTYSASGEYYASEEIPANGVFDVNDPVECDSAPALDISGCDTFTDIVDQAMLDDMGYANVTLNGEDLLLVCSRTVEQDGKPVALNATAYRYDDGKPVECGWIYSVDGLRIADDTLYCGGKDNMTSFTFKGSEVVAKEYAWSYSYAENEGDPEEMHYFYDPSGSGDEKDCECDEATFNKAMEPFEKAETIEFSVVHR